MDQGDRLVSLSSQYEAGQRAPKHTFETVRGWTHVHDNPGNAAEEEKQTIRWHTATVAMNVKGRNKKVASITSPILHNTFSLSGWTDDHPHLRIISSSLWTETMREFASVLKVQLPRHPLDKSYKDGWDGKFHASHAEAKLLAVYLDFYTNQAEASCSLGATMSWNPRILNVDVSDDVCSTCQEIARSMYERYQILVNFTVRGEVGYPQCKNHYCKKKMTDGLRVFCDVCQKQVDHLRMICLDLPQMDESQPPTLQLNCSYARRDILQSEGKYRDQRVRDGLGLRDSPSSGRASWHQMPASS